MEEDICSVETRGPQAVQETVPSEGEDGQGTIGFVRLCIGQREAPEIVAKDLRERCVTSAGLRV